MKTVVTPQVRVEPGLRARPEFELQLDEAPSELVEASAHRAVEVHQPQPSFRERGQAAWESYQRTGDAVPAETVLGKLKTRLDARYKQLRK